MHIGGKERRKLTTAYDEETGQGKVELIHVRLGATVDEEAKIAGLEKRNIKVGGKLGIWAREQTKEDESYRNGGNPVGE